MPKLLLDPTLSSPSPLAAVIVARLVGADVEWCVGQAKDTGSASGLFEACKSACLAAPESLPLGQDLDRWCSFCTVELATDAKRSYPDLVAAFAQIDKALRFRTFLSGTGLSLADVLVFCQLRATPIWAKAIKENKGAAGDDAQRWFHYLAAQPEFVEAADTLARQAAALRAKPKDQASYDIDLQGAEYGKVVTRFPPEPSGYLHIGHAKAVLLNQYFAQKYGGRLIVRFDDTNPTKENCEFEESILEDLGLLGVQGDILSRTSDYFPQCEGYAEQLIREGLAYCDDTPQERMREERFSGIESSCRGHSVEENMRRWQEMLSGSEEGLKNCLRAKIGMHHANKALRDPVIYRCQLTPHHRTGSRYKAYPTYDFACPIVDSLEGVTHSLRTSEYHDRNDQYYWILDALRLRKPQIWDYSRLNFVYTLLSKRKLQWFVAKGQVSGWDDPRFPTIRGIRRRGLTVEALREYILMQGPSKNTLLLEWDKLWAVNRKVIDPNAPRYVALDKAGGLVRLDLVDGPAEPYLSSVPRHKKNPGLGAKQTAFSRAVFIEQVDARAVLGSQNGTAGDKAEEEEVTLMDWGNVIISKAQTVTDDSGAIVSMKGRMNLSGDVRTTDKKLTWLSPDPRALLPLVLHDYDYLITKKKLEEDDSFEDCLTPVTEFITTAVGDANMAELRRGDIIQLERKGFYICDQPAVPSSNSEIHLIFIPDGKSKSLASKHQS